MTKLISLFDEQASLDEMNKGCKMAENEIFTTIVAKFEDINKNLETLMEFVSKLRLIICII